MGIFFGINSKIVAVFTAGFWCCSPSARYRRQYRRILLLLHYTSTPPSGLHGLFLGENCPFTQAAGQFRFSAKLTHNKSPPSYDHR